MKLNQPAASDQEISAHVGSELKRIRESLGYSPHDVEYQAGFSATILELLESGEEEITASHIYILSRCYGIAPGKLFFGLPGFEYPTRLKEEDASFLLQHFLKVDQPNRGQLFKDFISKVEE